MRVLVIKDDEELAGTLVAGLRQARMAVDSRSTARPAWRARSSTITT